MADRSGTHVQLTSGGLHTSVLMKTRVLQLCWTRPACFRVTRVFWTERSRDVETSRGSEQVLRSQLSQLSQLSPLVWLRRGRA